MKDDEGIEQDNPALFEKEIDYHRYWKKMYEKEHKLRQEAEGEMSILKTISVHSSPEMRDVKAKMSEMRQELDRVKLENNNLYTRVADALEVNEHHQNLNGKLQSRITELEQDNLELHGDNKKLANQIEDRISQMRKSGM
jgi:chromosome segregation ATPase